MYLCLNFWSEEQRWCSSNFTQSLEMYRRGNPDYRAARRNNYGRCFSFAARSLMTFYHKSSVKRCIFSFPGLLVPTETCQTWHLWNLMPWEADSYPIANPGEIPGGIIGLWPMASVSVTSLLLSPTPGIFCSRTKADDNINLVYNYLVWVIFPKVNKSSLFPLTRSTWQTVNWKTEKMFRLWASLDHSTNLYF